MPNILHLADVHISEWSALAGIVRTEEIADGVSVNAAMADLVRTVARICDLAVEGCGHLDGCVIAGDLFDRARPTPGEYAVANEVLYQIRARLPKGQSVLVIAGNHDQPRGATEASALEPLHWEGVRVHETPAVVQYCGLQVGLLPYPRRAAIADAGSTVGEWMAFQCARMAAAKASVLVVHANYRGAVSGTQPRPIEDDATIDVGQAQNFRAVLMGHIHKPQAWTTSMGHVAFPGSTVRQDWGEVGDPPHGALLWQLDEAGAVKACNTIAAEPRLWVDLDLAKPGDAAGWAGIETASPAACVWRLSGTLEHAALLQTRDKLRGLVRAGFYVQDNLQEAREDRARDVNIGKALDDREILARALDARGVTGAAKERALTAHDHLLAGG
jgi:DNA repair exonuclease SbcCD nuclease subunit